MDCSKPVPLQPWPSNPSIAVETVKNNTNDDVPICDPSKLKDEKLKTCQSYTQWSQVLGGADGLIMATATIVYSTLKKKGKTDLANDIYQSFGAIYTAIKGVNDEFLQAITDINEGKPFKPIESPSKIPDWPSHETPKEDGSNAKVIIEGIWATLKPILQVALQKLPDGSFWKIVLAGLIERGEEALEQLLPLLEKAFG